MVGQSVTDITSTILNMLVTNTVGSYTLFGVLIMLVCVYAAIKLKFDFSTTLIIILFLGLTLPSVGFLPDSVRAVSLIIGGLVAGIVIINIFKG